MKKVIITIAVSGALSLGFTLINNTHKNEKVAIKPENTEKMDFSHKLDEKRLASWD